MMKIALEFAGMFLLAACAAMPPAPLDVRSDLAPTGKLRVGVNYGNPILVQKDPATGEPRGIIIDLSVELARRLGVPVEYVFYDSAGKMTDAITTGAWDLAFLAVDPKRAAEISFTAPYIEIEGVYLVPAGSRIRTIEDVDREGVRIAVGAKSAYDLFLTRNLKHAKLMRATTFEETIDLFLTGKLEVLAGVKQPIVEAAAKIPGSRVLEGRFMVINQASGVPKGREAGARYLREFIEEAKASGMVARSLKNSGVVGVSIAPPAPVK
jgi:polar amino acid transport system substrate-binding protein